MEEVVMEDKAEPLAGLNHDRERNLGLANEREENGKGENN